MRKDYESYEMGPWTVVHSQNEETILPFHHGCGKDKWYLQEVLFTSKEKLLFYILVDYIRVNWKNGGLFSPVRMSCSSCDRPLPPDVRAFMNLVSGRTMV